MSAGRSGMLRDRCGTCSHRRAPITRMPGCRSRSDPRQYHRRDRGGDAINLSFDGGNRTCQALHSQPGAIACTPGLDSSPSPLGRGQSRSPRSGAIETGEGRIFDKTAIAARRRLSIRRAMDAPSGWTRPRLVESRLRPIPKLRSSMPEQIHGMHHALLIEISHRLRGRGEHLRRCFGDERAGVLARLPHHVNLLAVFEGMLQFALHSR